MFYVCNVDFLRTTNEFKLVKPGSPFIVTSRIPRKKKRDLRNPFPLLLSVLVGKGAAVGAAKLALTSHHFILFFIFKTKSK
jgi:hypothetical protein